LRHARNPTSEFRRMPARSRFRSRLRCAIAILLVNALQTARIVLLGSAGCQPAAFGSLPNAFGKVKNEADTNLFAASCRGLQASGLCSPKPRRARYSELGVCACADARDSRCVTGCPTGK
jgi:hypothetical protein